MISDAVSVWVALAMALASHHKYDKVCAHRWTRNPIMADIERLTITLPAEMAAVVKGAVEEGDYASASEVVRAALRDWKVKRALQLQELAALKADIDKGLADVAAGRVKKFDAARIIERGRKLLADRSPSA
jgi:antitoxin ParD1/3/4